MLRSVGQDPQIVHGCLTGIILISGSLSTQAQHVALLISTPIPQNNAHVAQHTVGPQCSAPRKEHNDRDPLGGAI